MTTKKRRRAARKSEAACSDHILFSVRQRITKMVTNWYDAHPEIPVCTFNTIMVLNYL